MDNEDIFLVSLVVGLIVICATLWTISERQWDKFKIEHHCKITAHIEGSLNPGISSSGKTVMTYDPNKTGWLCDDGITYFR